MGTFDNLKGKVSDLVDKHSDKIDDGMNKAGNMIDSKTGGKHTDKIATGKEKVRNALDGLDGQNDDFPDREAPTARPASSDAPDAPDPRPDPRPATP